MMKRQERDQFSVTIWITSDIVLVPIRSGVGLRLGANVGYLKFTPQSVLTQTSSASRRRGHG
jgi:hypothetical protein